MSAVFFKTAVAFRAWLARHHDSATELLVGLHKVGSGRKSITYQEALDEALAFGWIDGVRRRLDDESYSIRFTPRKPTSIWSAVNIKRVKELEVAGRMAPAGLAAFAKRDEKRSAIYSYERDAAALDAEALTTFAANEKALEFYERQAPWYRRTTAHWVISAKRPETRDRRLRTLIDYSARGERIPMLTPPKMK
ncbi:MAG TPA: YdeI/OmpD-associated family protein [Gemmatimonadaceae bacterium]|nr:YdeI/OmpD-associated family protein [Gemmatimonadaceae bacterium]